MNKFKFKIMEFGKLIFTGFVFAASAGILLISLTRPASGISFNFGKSRIARNNGGRRFNPRKRRFVKPGRKGPRNSFSEGAFKHRNPNMNGQYKRRVNPSHIGVKPNKYDMKSSPKLMKSVNPSHIGVKPNLMGGAHIGVRPKK